MSLRRLGLLAGLLVTGFALLEPSPAADKKPFTDEQLALFEKEALPVLEANCIRCHSGNMPKGKLRLDSREGVLKGGKIGPAVSLDEPDDSNLLAAIRHESLKMPPDGKLAAKDVEVLTRWVKAGVPWKPGVVAADKFTGGGGKVTEESKNYWAYKPVQRPSVPKVKNNEWVQNPVDAFILAKLEAKGLTPAPPAERAALVRRATYDLIGLPPTPEEVDAFVKDKSPDAYEKLIDRLLASAHYGEKWGRHWLDLVRYAETNGYERDGPKPFVWRYRDYVIKSFNDDKPFDRFVEEQLAGDEIDRDNPDAVIATGYYRLGLWDDEPADPAQARADETDDLVATTAQVFLGMTMNCARCHDHKIDPIPQKDYYALAAFFRDIQPYSNTRNTSSRTNLTDVSPPEKRARYEKELKEREERINELTAAVTKIEDAAIKKMPAEDQRAAEGPDREKVLARKLKEFLTEGEAKEYARLKGELDQLRKKPEPAEVLALSINHCLVDPPETFVLVRGNPHAPAAKVVPAFPSVLGAGVPTIPAPAKDARSSGRRTVLANWIASKDNPLTARVLANRLWQHHFGVGIVASSNDFGKFGTGPTHPELLDWLASEVVEGSWKLKRMHKLLMLSSAYQMSVKANPDGLRADPANALLWRFNMRRLTAEEVRDSMLAVSGKLNLKTGGPSIYPPIPKEVLAGQSVPGQGWNTSPPEEACRRSVYIHIKRSLLVPLLAQHDQADTDNSCPVRFTTTVPTQALGMLNGAFTNEQAAAFAERLRKEAPDDLAAQVRRAARLTTGVVPPDDKVQRDVDFIKELQAKGKLSAAEALKNYCLLMLNTNAFMYLD
jgi:hypothetical protein